MNKEKISSQEIIDLVASKASVSKRAAEEFLKVMIASVEEGLQAGEVVKIKNFGTFKLQWNEPRKSVNVQSGEEILIAGYYKVVFVPDTALKEQVNEPFAHLEPVELDVQTKKNELIIEDEVASDPLRLFNEQAFEIKNLISEIQALSSKTGDALTVIQKNEEPVIEEEKTITKVDIEQSKNDEGHEVEEEKSNDRIVIEQTPVETTVDEVLVEIEPEKVYKDDEIIESPRLTNEKPDDNIQTTIQDIELNSDLPTTPYLDNIKAPKKKKVWLWVILIFLICSVSGIGVYYYSKSDSEFSDKYSVTGISNKFSITELLNTISGWFAPEAKKVTKVKTIVIPKDTSELDSISQIQPVDSIQLLFDTPREYNDFIASERTKAGSRLTIMSKRYYGNKDFWVYIYEANKDKIMNPDNIAIGTLIKIPKLDPRLIDVTNPRCLEKARQLHDIYIN